MPRKPHQNLTRNLDNQGRHTVGSQRKKENHATKSTSSHQSPRRSGVDQGMAQLIGKGGCGVKFTPCGTTKVPKLLVEYFASDPASVEVAVAYFRTDGTEIANNVDGNRSAGQIDLSPYLGPPSDHMEGRIVKHCQPRFSGGRKLTISPQPRKQASHVSVTFSLLDRDVSRSFDHAFRIERRKSRLGLGDRPMPSYGFPLTLPEAHARIEWLTQHFGLLGPDEWRSNALDRVLNYVYGGEDSPLVLSPLEHNNEDLNRIMRGIVKYSRRKSKSPGSTWEPLTVDPEGPIASESCFDPERRSWHLDVAESLLEECTPDPHILEFVGCALKRDDGTSLKKLSDEFDIHYPTARSYFHRAKKYLGLV